MKFKIKVKAPKIKASSIPSIQQIKPAKKPVADEVINFVNIYFFT